MEEAIHYRILGKFYGYPPCCIEEFIQKIRSHTQILASRYTGFIPCGKHADEILAGRQTLESILRHRVCESPL